MGDRRVSFDLLDFHHNESRLFGVDTRKRNAVAATRTRQHCIQGVAT
jgi:NADPH:quinone reductase